MRSDADAGRICKSRGGKLVSVVVRHCFSPYEFGVFWKSYGVAVYPHDRLIIGYLRGGDMMDGNGWLMGGGYAGTFAWANKPTTGQIGQYIIISDLGLNGVNFCWTGAK